MISANDAKMIGAMKRILEDAFGFIKPPSSFEDGCLKLKLRAEGKSSPHTFFRLS
jgi:hypothetical protein